MARRSAVLCGLAGLLLGAVAWTRISERRNDQAMLRQEAAAFGFSDVGDYQEFFAMDGTAPLNDLSNRQLLLLKRVSDTNPRYRSLVLLTLGRLGNTREALRAIPFVQACLKDPELEADAEALAVTWDERGFKGAAREVRRVVRAN